MEKKNVTSGWSFKIAIIQRGLFFLNFENLVIVLFIYQITIIQLNLFRFLSAFLKIYS